MRNFYFAGTLLDIANQLLREKLSKLSDTTNAYQLYRSIQPFEVLYFKAAVSKTYCSSSSHFNTTQTEE